MANELKVALEVGPRGKKVVAVAPDWPGLERGAKTEEAAIEKLQCYLPRYAQVAELARLGKEFAAISDVKVIEQYRGIGSTDFWGISFAFSSIDVRDMSSQELKRELRLLQACWAFFDDVRSRVSNELQKGPRGGGRDRDQIVRHILANERQWAGKVGLPAPEGVAVADDNGLGDNGLGDNGLGDNGSKAFRGAYCAAIQTYHSEGKMARTWPLRYLIRHTAFHTMDHAWEMQDKDLTAAVG